MLLSGSLRTSARVVMRNSHTDTAMSTIKSVCDKSCGMTGRTADEAQPTIMHNSLLMSEHQGLNRGHEQCSSTPKYYSRCYRQIMLWKSKHSYMHDASYDSLLRRLSMPTHITGNATRAPVSTNQIQYLSQTIEQYLQFCRPSGQSDFFVWASAYYVEAKA